MTELMQKQGLVFQNKYKNPNESAKILQKFSFLRNGFTIILILFFITFNSCQDGINIFSINDDVKLGNQLHQQITSNPKEYPILNNNQAESYVQEIVNQILQSPLIKYRDVFIYKVTILKDDNTVNAFATPGGYIYVYTGLLKFLDNEATLAGVLAHEIAHIELRHSTQRMTKAYGVSLLIDIVLGKNPSKLEEIGANLFVGLALMKNSRDDEYEADSYSYDYLKSTVWYPGSLIFFFDKIKKNEGSSLFNVLLSTHPLTQDRIDKLNQKIKRDNIPTPSESNMFEQRYSVFKKNLP